MYMCLFVACTSLVHAPPAILLLSFFLHRTADPFLLPGMLTLALNLLLHRYTLLQPYPRYSLFFFAGTKGIYFDNI